MRIYKEIRLSQFDFYGGAVDLADKLTEEQFDRIEDFLEDCEADGGWDEGSINDLFAYDSDLILNWFPFEESAHIVLDDIEEGEDHYDLIDEFANDIGGFADITEERILTEYRLWIEEQSRIRAIEHITSIVDDELSERIKRIAGDEDDVDDYIENFVEDFMGNHEFFTIDPCVTDFLDSVTKEFLESVAKNEKIAKKEEKGE